MSTRRKRYDDKDDLTRWLQGKTGDSGETQTTSQQKPQTTTTQQATTSTSPTSELESWLQGKGATTSETTSASAGTSAYYRYMEEEQKRRKARQELEARRNATYTGSDPLARILDRGRKLVRNYADTTGLLDREDAEARADDLAFYTKMYQDAVSSGSQKLADLAKRRYDETYAEGKQSEEQMIRKSTAYNDKRKAAYEAWQQQYNPGEYYGTRMTEDEIAQRQRDIARTIQFQQQTVTDAEERANSSRNESIANRPGYDGPGYEAEMETVSRETKRLNDLKEQQARYKAAMQHVQDKKWADMDSKYSIGTIGKDAFYAKARAGKAKFDADQKAARERAGQRIVQEQGGVDYFGRPTDIVTTREAIDIQGHSGVFDLPDDDNTRWSWYDITEFYAMYDDNPEQAKAWLEQTKRMRDEQEIDAFAYWSGKDAMSRVGAFVLSPAFSLASGLDPYGSWGQKASRIAEGMQKGVTEGLTEHGLFDTGALAGEADVPGLGKISLGTFAGIGMSMVQSGLVALPAAAIGDEYTVAQKVVEFLGTALMGSSAAASDYREKLNAGWSETDAMTHSLWAGLAEAGFEYVSLDKLVDQDVTRGIFKNIFTQGGIEASEEFCTTVANRISDAALARKNGYNTAIEDRADELVAEGYSYEGAMQQAKKEWITELINDAFAGFVSGSGMTGMHHAAASVEQAAATRSQRAELARSVQGTEGAVEAARKYAADRGLKAVKDSKGTTRQDARQGKGLQAVQEDITKRIEDAAKEGGVQGANQVYSELVEKYGDGIRTLADAALDSAVSTAVTETTEGRRANAYSVLAHQETVEGIQDERAREISKGAMERAAYIAAMQSNDEAEWRKASDYGRNHGQEMTMQATVTNEDGSERQVGIESVNTAEGTVKLADGETVSFDSLTADPDTKDVVQAMLTSDMTEEASARMLRTFQAQTAEGMVSDPYRWAMDYVTSYDRGRVGSFSLEKAQQSVDVLHADTVKIAYEAGQAVSAQLTQAQRDKLNAALAIREKGASGRAGSLDVGELAEKIEADEGLKAEVERIRKFAEVFGIDVGLFESGVKNGRYQGENGRYQDGKIWLDINAGRNKVGDVARGMVQTMAHEMTHFMQEYNPEDYAGVKRFVMQQIAAQKGENAIKELVDDKKKRHTGSKPLSTTMAEDEIVADFCADMLTDKTALETMAREDPKGFQALVQWIKDFMQKVFGKLAGRPAGSYEAQVYRSMEQSLRDAFGEAWGKGIVGAVQTHDVVGSLQEAERLGASAQMAEEATMQQSDRLDEETLEFLDNQEHVTVYRAMQLIDGQLYPPMAAKVEGKLVEPTEIGKWYQSVERPDLVKNGKFTLNKGNGTSVPAAYNPYFHCSASPLNDQFSSAYKRPNLVVVEGIIPKSELTSGYKAEGAKNSVGETQWHAGPVASKLKGAKARRVFLSRYFQVTRIMSDAEVAGIVAKTLQGENVSIPSNVVTPSLLEALKAQGVAVDETGIERFEGQHKKKNPTDNPDIRKQDRDAEYLELAKAPQKNAARLQEMVDEAAERSFANSKIRKNDGKLRKLFHGTNSGSFTVFDKDLIGTAREGDVGFFGRGFYFSFHEGEARMYGRNIIEAYLNIENPFNYLEELGKYDGERVHDYYGGRMVFAVNFAKKFPELATKHFVTAWDKTTGEKIQLTLKEFSDIFESVYHDKVFKVESLKTWDGTEWLVTADMREKSYTDENGNKFTWPEYGFEQRFYSETDARNKLFQVSEYLQRTMFDGLEVPASTDIIQETDFSEALKSRGYDGVIQSEEGDEVVAFESSQIKSADPVTYDDSGKPIPLSQRFDTENVDIRYSMRDNDAPSDLDLLDGFSQEDAANEEQRRLLREAQASGKKLREAQRQLERLRADLQALEGDNPSRITIQDFRRNVLDLFGIPSSERNGDIGNMVQSIAEGVLAGAKLNRDDISFFFQTFVESGTMRTEPDEYLAQIRDDLRGRRVYVNKQVRENLGDDYAALRKRAFGLGITLTSNEKDMGIDQHFAELAEMYPGSFDSEELDLGTMLTSMIDYAESGKASTVSILDGMRQIEGQTGEPIRDQLQRMYDSFVRHIEIMEDRGKLEARARAGNAAEIAKAKAKAEKAREELAKVRKERNEWKRKATSAEKRALDKLQAELRKVERERADERRAAQMREIDLKAQKFGQAARASKAEAALAQETVRSQGWEHVADLSAKEIDRLMREKRSLIKKLEDQIAREQKILTGKLNTPQLAKMLKTARETAAKEMAKHKDEVFARAKERKKASELRSRIKNLSDEMKRRMTRPTDGAYVPASLYGSMTRLAEVLDEFLAPNPGTKAAERYKAMLDKIRDLSAQYRGVQDLDDPTYASEYYEDIQSDIDAIERTLTTHEQAWQDQRTWIDRMTGDAKEGVWKLSTAELQHIYELMRSINFTMKNAAKTLSWNEGKSLYDAMRSVAEQQRELTPLEETGKFETSKRGRLLRKMSTMRAVEMMAGYQRDAALYQLMHGIEQGVVNSDTWVMNYEKAMQPLKNGKNELEYRKAISKKLDFGATTDRGTKVLMTKMQAIQILMTAEREAHNDTKVHLQRGGAVIRDKSSGKSYTIQVTPELLKNIQDSLTEWDGKYIWAIYHYFEREGKATNEILYKLKHRVLQTEQFYVPYQVDKNYLETKLDKPETAMSMWVKTPGFVNPTKDNASQPVIIDGMDAVMQHHVREIANYIGLALPIRDFSKVYNGMLRQGEGKKPLPVKETIYSNFGEDGQKILTQAVIDIQGGRRGNQHRTGMGKFLEAMQSSFYKTALLINPSVTIKQAASYVAIESILDHRAVIAGNRPIFVKADKSWSPSLIAHLFAAPSGATAMRLYNEIDAHTSMHYMRRQGMSMRELASQVNRDGPIARAKGMVGASMEQAGWIGHKARQAAEAISPLNWIQRMDVATTAAIWVACKEQAKLDGMEVGTEEYWQHVTELYERCLRETQPMYDDLHRNEYQKDREGLMSYLFPFRTVPIQNHGQLANAFENMRAARKSGNKTRMKAANRFFRKTVAAQTMSAAVFSVMTFLAAALKRKTKKYRDDDEEISAETIGIGIGKDVVGTLISVFAPLLGSTVWDTGNNIYDAVRTGNNIRSYDSFSVGVVDLLNDLESKTKDIATDVAGLIAGNDVDQSKFRDHVMAMVEAGAKCAGIPYTTIKTYYGGVKDNITDFLEGRIPALNDEAVERTNAVNAGRYWKAWVAGDDAKMGTVLDEMIQNYLDDGKDEEQAHELTRNALGGAVMDRYTDGELDLQELSDYMEGTGLWDDEKRQDKLAGIIRDELQTGLRDEDEAIDLLTDLCGWDEDKAWKKAKEWSAKAEHADDEDYSYSQYDEIDEALARNDNIEALVVEMTDHGVKADSIRSHVKSWLIDNYVKGNVSEYAFKNQLSRYLKITATDDVEKILKDANSKKSYGVAYSSLDEEYRAGHISRTDLVKALKQYGGLSDDDANKKVRWYDLQKKYPDMEITEAWSNHYYDGTSKTQENGHESASAAGMTIKQYVDAMTVLSKVTGTDANGDGKTDTNSKEIAYIAAIDAMNLTGAQKWSLYYEVYKGANWKKIAKPNW